jgi:lipoprotein-anchoring transpeptidase ErfK/SrfK
MIGKTGIFLSMAGLAVLSVPEEAPSPPPEISATLAIRDAAPAAGAAGAKDAAKQDSGKSDPRPAAVRALVITQEIAVTRWLEPGEYVWDEDAAAQAQGPATVVVNLRSRTLSAYRGGKEIGRSSILYGYGEHPTPLGTFKVLQRKKDHISNIYNAPMPHMLRLTSDGVALHGSQQLTDDGATHGCVGLPVEFAALLFDHVKVGDQVVIWSGRASG